MRWQFGAVLPPEIKANLCEPEQEFFTKYNRNVFTHKIRRNFIEKSTQTKLIIDSLYVSL